jgi:hypothetical protein
MLMEPVESEVISDQEENQKTAGDPGGQTGNVDKGMPFVALQIPESDLKIVFDHGLFSCIALACRL